jgi:WD40 repeat protein
MIKVPTQTVLFVLLVINLPACQGAPAPTLAATSLPTRAATPTTLPSATVPPASPTAVLTVGPASAATAPCFVTYLAPIAFSPDGTRTFVRAEKGVQVYNLQTAQEESFIPSPAEKTMLAVAVSPDGETLAWSLDDNTIQLIRVEDGKLLHTLQGHTDMIGKLRFSPDGSRLYSASHDTWVRVWDMDGDEVFAFQPTGANDLPNEVLGMGISPDGKVLATIPFDGPVKLWNAQDGSLIKQLGGTGAVDTTDVVFSPDGQLVAADTATGLFLWETADGTELLGGNPGINSMAVAFAPDGRFLAYGEIGETSVIVFASPDGNDKIRTLEGHAGPVGELIFSPDGSHLLSSDWVETRLWRVEDGALISIGKTVCP